MWHYVYILRNAQGKQYVGHTDDINARLKEHNEGSVIATKGGRPWEMGRFCGFSNKRDAILFEEYSESGSGRNFRDRHLVPK